MVSTRARAYVARGSVERAATCDIKWLLKGVEHTLAHREYEVGLMNERGLQCTIV